MSPVSGDSIPEASCSRNPLYKAQHVFFFVWIYKGTWVFGGFFLYL